MATSRPSLLLPLIIAMMPVGAFAAGAAADDVSPPIDPLGVRLARTYSEFAGDGNSPELAEFLHSEYDRTRLEWMLRMGESPVRRAAAYGLRVLGDFSSAPVLASAMHDPDSQVRRLVTESSWIVWQRAGTADQQLRLRVAMERLSRGLGLEAYYVCTDLIKSAPDYAEAYNQRAIASFQLQRFEQSADDCRRALKLNPFHFGAAAGMAQCYMQLNRHPEALKAFELLQRLNPDMPGVEQQIRTLRRLKK